MSCSVTDNEFHAFFSQGGNICLSIRETAGVHRVGVGRGIGIAIEQGAIFLPNDIGEG